jgi:hypothetical protein
VGLVRGIILGRGVWIWVRDIRRAMGTWECLLGMFKGVVDGIGT